MEFLIGLNIPDGLCKYLLNILIQLFTHPLTNWLLRFLLNWLMHHRRQVDRQGPKLKVDYFLDRIEGWTLGLQHETIEPGVTYSHLLVCENILLLSGINDALARIANVRFVIDAVRHLVLVFPRSDPHVRVALFVPGQLDPTVLRFRLDTELGRGVAPKGALSAKIRGHCCDESSGRHPKPGLVEHEVP